GEYHEMGSELIPERARVDGQQTFDRFALKKFLSGQGWLVKIEPRGKTDGLFKAQLNRLGGSASHKPEIDIDELKARIRTAVELRQADGRTNFIKTSGELFELLSAQLSGPTSISIADTALSVAETPYLTRLSLQPEFLPRSDDHYHVDDLLKYHDSQFIGNAYRALLRRKPDEPGLRTYLAELRSGRFNKLDVLASLRFSPEGRRNNVTVDGLRARAIFRRAYRLPLLGYLMELGVGIARLPSLIRNQRASE